MSSVGKAVRLGICDNKLIKVIRDFKLGIEHEVLEYSGDPNMCDLVIASDSEIQGVVAAIKNGHRPTLFTTVSESDGLPSTFQDGLCDDVIALPMRRIDLIRAIRLHFTFQTIRELEHTSAALPEVIKKLEEDVQLAQKIQRKLIRDRFMNMGPISIKSKYWCGLKAGGDYFDVIEFADGVHAGIFMADASSYSLSTALLNSLMQLSLQGNDGVIISPEERLSVLGKKLSTELKEKDKLSIFFGIINRKTLKLDYVSHGSMGLVLERNREFKTILAGDSKPLTKSDWAVSGSQTLQLENEDRMVLFSDGWAEGAKTNGIELVSDALKQSRNDSQAFVNELSFKMKKHVDEDSMPPQDCSVLVFEVARSALRLAQ